MRQILLFRHAKSSWQTEGQDDFERPLNNRGRKAAPIMGAFMRRHGLSPDLILCSTACRARETLALILPSLQGEATILLEDRLYLASASRLLHRLQRIGGSTRAVMVVAHNPGLHELAAMLSAPAEGSELDRVKDKFPTAALAEIELPDGDWSAVAPHTGRLTRFTTPRALDADRAGQRQ